MYPTAHKCVQACIHVNSQHQLYRATEPAWQRFERFTALTELVIISEDRVDQDHTLSNALSLVLPRANVLVAPVEAFMSFAEWQLGFDIIWHESEGHTFGGLRPLHRSLLPHSPEPWHMHALPLSFPEREHFFPAIIDGPLLEGPLAFGEGPPGWLADIEQARQLEAASDYPSLL